VYLTINKYGNYWLYSPLKAGNTTNKTIRKVFENYHKNYFTPTNFYRKDNNIYIRDTCDSTILLELPDNYTYEQFVQDYPEMLL